MSEVKIKELDKSLIHRANSNSMSGKRGDISAHEYEVYCQKVMSWNIPDSRKQKIVDQIYAKWSEQLRHEAAHVSVAVAGPARYNAKKLDHSDTILRLSSEFVEVVQRPAGASLAGPHRGQERKGDCAAGR